MSFCALPTSFLSFTRFIFVSKNQFKFINRIPREVGILRMSGAASILNPIPVWLDCDPGHDDAFAILLATQSTQKIKLLGISIVHGNDTVKHCAKNALRMLWTCGVKVPVYKGIQTPLTRKPKFCPEIHGIPGEQGVAGMCGYHFPDHRIFKDEDNNGQGDNDNETHGVIAMARAITSYPSKVTVVLTGAQTNFAFCLRMFPEVKDKVEKVVFMGGAIGLGNTGVAAEFNIQIDPEAASIVFHSGIPLVMIPLEVTHKVLVTPYILDKLANIDNIDVETGTSSGATFNSSSLPHRHVEYPEVFKAVERHDRRMAGDGVEKGRDPSGDLEVFSSPFAECCYKLLTFFQGTYCREFGFTSPPLHDPCTIFYLTNPECFKTDHLFVDVETESEKCAGRTLCDMNNLWGRQKNVLVCTDIDTERFWKRMLTCVKMVSGKSPMNV